MQLCFMVRKNNYRIVSPMIQIIGYLMVIFEAISVFLIVCLELNQQLKDLNSKVKILRKSSDLKSYLRKTAAMFNSHELFSRYKILQGYLRRL